MGILSKLWSFIKKWWWLILIIAIIVIAIYFPAFLTTIQSFLASAWKWFVKLPWWGQALVALGIAYAVDKEGTIAFVENAVGAVAGFVGNIAGAIVGGVAKSPIGVAVIGIAAYFLLKKGDDGKSRFQNYQEKRQAQREAVAGASVTVGGGS